MVIDSFDKMPKTKAITETQFTEVNNTGVFVSETEANHAKSMKLLKHNHLRPLTYQEALVLIDRNLDVKARLKGKWFHLDGKGLKESGWCTFDNEGKLVEGKGDMEKTIYAYPGKNPLWLNVLTDTIASFIGSRFDLVADEGPLRVVLVVVGVKIRSKIEGVLRTED